MIGILLLAGSAFTACSSSDDEINRIGNDERKVTLVVRATKGTDRALTRALADEGATISATWTEGDEVAVYSNTTKIGTLTATPDATDATKATLSGSVSGTLTSGNSLTLRYKYAAGYLQNQDGTLETIANKFDYASATVTVNPITPGATETVVTTTDADFQNMYAIVKFSLANASGSVNAQVLNFIIDSKYYNATLTTASSELYVAMPGISNKKLPIVVYDGTNGYRKVQEGVTFAAGKFYKVNITFGEPLSAPAGAEAVDLGLASGTKWANMNVGASSETGIGIYFAWGEVMGFKSNTDYDKYVFNVDNNVWLYGSSASDTPVYKYISTTNNNNNLWKGSGPKDGKLTLEAADDAATVYWGGPWKMPTPDQFQELCNTKSDTENYLWTYCDGTNTQYKESSQPGWKIEVIKDGDLNGRGNFHGNTIFIQTHTSLTEEANSGGISPYYPNVGNYWTSKVTTGNYPGNAYGYRINSSETGYEVYTGAWSNSNRRVGMQVRPVQ